MTAIRVLVVEDSITQRHQLVSLIERAPDMSVIGQARDGLEAIAMVEKLHPDVISMDLRMPHLGGLEATRHIMGQNPTPIVIVSSAKSDADLTMQAMQAGALAAIEKPPAKDHPDFNARCFELISALRLMAGVSVIRHWNTAPVTVEAKPRTGVLDAKRSTLSMVMPENSAQPEIVAIGASAGGPSALAQLLSALPVDFGLPVIVVQHLTADFVPGLADWLRRVSRLPVRLAQQGDMPVRGEVLLAPGGSHLSLSTDRRIVLDSTIGSYRHHPAVDVTLKSIAEVYAQRAIGVILTGMGDDGAAGLRAMRDCGSRTIAQDEASCIVFGMPAAAIALNAAEYILPLDKIPAALVKLSTRVVEKQG